MTIAIPAAPAASIMPVSASAPTNPLTAMDPTSAAVANRQMMLNKIRGGMPMTQEALGQLGAGQPYGS